MGCGDPSPAEDGNGVEDIGTSDLDTDADTDSGGDAELALFCERGVELARRVRLLSVQERRFSDHSDRYFTGYAEVDVVEDDQGGITLRALFAGPITPELGEFTSVGPTVDDLPPPQLLVLGTSPLQEDSPLRSFDAVFSLSTGSDDPTSTCFEIRAHDMGTALNAGVDYGRRIGGGSLCNAPLCGIVWDPAFAGLSLPHAMDEQLVMHERDDEGSLINSYASPHIAVSLVGGLEDGNIRRVRELDSRCNSSGILCEDDLHLVSMSDLPMERRGAFDVHRLEDGPDTFDYSRADCALVYEERFVGTFSDLETNASFLAFESVEVLELSPLDAEASDLVSPSEWTSCAQLPMGQTPLVGADPPPAALPESDVAAFRSRLQSVLDGVERP